MKKTLSLISIIVFLIGAYMFTRPADIGSNLTIFYTGFIIASIGYLGIIDYGIPFGRKWFLVILFTVIIIPRIFAINMIPSDDVARYVWEGRMLMEGYNPYDVAPDDPRLENYRDDIYDQINHKDMPAIYPSLALYVFAMLSKSGMGIEGFRLVVILIEFITILLMMLWLRIERIPRIKIVIYALNPIVIIGIAGRGHFEPIQVLLIIAGLVLYSRGRFGWGILAIILAGLTKYLAFFALPFFINRKTIRYLPPTLLIIAVSYAGIFMLEGSASLGNMGVFLGQFEFYSLTFAPLRFLFGTAGAHTITGLALIFAMFSLWLTRTKPIYAVTPFLLLVTLTSTTIHYWYIIPLLALNIVWRNRALIILSLAFLPYFEVFGEFVKSGIWQGDIWRQMLTYMIFIFVWWKELSGQWLPGKKQKLSLGIVVPVLNDAGPLRKLLESFEQFGISKDNVIISDGGSEDESVNTAEEMGFSTIICKDTGRGGQIVEAANRLDTDLIAVIHADTEIEPNLVEKIIDSARSYPDSAGGACYMRYSDGSLRLKLLSMLSNFKSLFFGLSFGDQVQWYRKSRIDMPDLALMEDVELAVRVNDNGGYAQTRSTVKVSSRRYKEKGIIRVIMSVLRRTPGYLIVRKWTDEMPETKNLYKKYYR
jgi:hypothetical protein